jgi:hypothetical protein
MSDSQTNPVVGSVQLSRDPALIRIPSEDTGGIDVVGGDDAGAVVGECKTGAKVGDVVGKSTVDVGIGGEAG